MSKLKLYAGLFLAGLVLGIFLSSFFIGGSGRPAKPVIKPTAIVHEVRAAEATSSKRLDSLERTNKQLAGHLQTVTGELQSAKKRSNALQTQLYNLIDRTATAADQQDTAQWVSNCDQLKDTVAAYIVAAAQKDSFYEACTLNLEEQLRNKNATITEQTLRYDALKVFLDKSLTGLQQANDENKRMSKQFRRQKFKSTVKTIGIVIATAFATHYLSQH